MKTNSDRNIQGFLHCKDLAGRRSVYERIAELLTRLQITYALDCGCSYGILVELLNSRGIDASGVDFDAPEIRAYHTNLHLSRGKFYYGDVTALRLLTPSSGSALTLLDCLRYIPEPQRLSQLNTEYIIIKEVADNQIMRRSRSEEFDRRLYSPADCAALFPQYTVAELYASRFIFKVTSPHRAALKCFNILPTYTLVLHRNTAMQQQAC